ncbi:transmembrane protein, putative (macronuclear) [Tetrahymena thermophila SB210]|uniref:Transmembrane protein, putative n=1 Tax=Tetrahymena thermophila (strain SB210) TaxID=312017 RepID=Q22XV9_TETTS|nr:transmembrane protein, putative [Tetrahymena thermophila SB210]EAR90265.1 transmembrane protein, putative [Tetrahymena thermophila SB210]|eukprot:XP_001010510.1 transmembrane protein, putative [Tetrahymena thermophila SB210]
MNTSKLTTIALILILTGAALYFIQKNQAPKHNHYGVFTKLSPYYDPEICQECGSHYCCGDGICTDELECVGKSFGGPRSGEFKNDDPDVFCQICQGLTKCCYGHCSYGACI